MTRVAITGVGTVGPLGSGRQTFWSNLTAGRSGIGPISLFDASAFPVRIGGEAKGLTPAVAAELAEAFPLAAGVRDRKVLLGLAAAREAVAAAGIANGSLDDAMLHVGVGLESFHLEDLTRHAGADDIGQAIVESVRAGDVGEPMQTPLDLTAEALGQRYGFSAGRYTNCSACAAGAQVIGEAWRLLREGACDVVLAGATDSMLNPLGLGGFSLLRVLSAENDRPQRACRPFDATRQGTALGEGAGFVVLETLDHALWRGAKILAEVLGYGSSMDAYRVSDPDPSGAGAVRSMAAALGDAGLEAGQIDCVSAHGTGTPKNDVVETAAIKTVLGPRAREIPVHAVKSMTGHLIAASGAVEAIAAVLTILWRTVPPTINLETPDEQCDLDYVAGGSRAFDGDIVLSNSFGFGGQNATLIFGRYA